jgi:hypothetical protein
MRGWSPYSPLTDARRFLTPDPVPGGNANTYVYPTDPITMYDLNGQWGIHFKKIFHAAVNVVKDHWNDIAVGAACTFAGPMGCLAASAINMGYKAATGQYHSWADVGVDAAISVVGFGAGRAMSGGWMARNVEQDRGILSTSSAASHRAAVNWGATASNWGKNAALAGAAYGAGYAWGRTRGD